MLSYVFSLFDTGEDNVTDISPIGNGLINSTYLVRGKREYVLQKVNTDVFKDPYSLMDNISKVCEFLGKNNGSGEYLHFYPACDGHLYVNNEYGFWRLMDKLDGCTVDIADTTALLKVAGRAFGSFARSLEAFPVGELAETIPDFHNTPKRLEALVEARNKDLSGRYCKAETLYGKAITLGKNADLIVSAMSDGSVPRRVTHNDTKISNVVVTNDLKDFVAVIDLDTIMPGSLLYDFGDAQRTCCAIEAEDNVNIKLNTERFAAFASGYLESVGDILAEREKELLVFSAFLMTYECGIRFLTDYLNGDTYFKIKDKEHNLRRASAQLSLAEQILANREELERALVL